MESILNKKITRGTLVRNILSVFELDTNSLYKKGWYDEAHQICCSIAKLSSKNVDPVIVAATMAVLSPQTDWVSNIALTARLWGVNPEDIYTTDDIDFSSARSFTTKARMAKAEAIKESDLGKAVNIHYHDVPLIDRLLDLISSPKSKKTRNFFLNIAFPNIATGVTIDRHAITVALDGDKKYKRKEYSERFIYPAEYDMIEQAYIQASIVLAERNSEQHPIILPHELQAITWCNLKEFLK